MMEHFAPVVLEMIALGLWGVFILCRSLLMKWRNETMKATHRIEFLTQKGEVESVNLAHIAELNAEAKEAAEKIDETAWRSAVLDKVIANITKFIATKKLECEKSREDAIKRGAWDEVGSAMHLHRAFSLVSEYVISKDILNALEE